MQSISRMSMSGSLRFHGGSLLSTLAEHNLLGADGGEELPDAQSKPLLHERVVDPIGVASFEDQACILEHTQMPGYRGSADREARGNVAHGELPALEILKDLASGGIGESFEHPCVIIHICRLANVLITNKSTPVCPCRLPHARLVSDGGT